MKKPRESTIFLLKALLPYSQENLSLSFNPTKFFNDLERLDKKQRYSSRKSLQQAFYKLKNSGLITNDNGEAPVLTEKGYLQLSLYEPKVLGDSVLLVTFDIPEEQRYKRRVLRSTLRALKFKPIQQSVWSSKYDGRKILEAEIDKLQIKQCVTIYEARKIN